MALTAKKDLSNSRDALIAAAERLFVERGFAAVSTREIADEAGVNLGAIQYHFGSKGKLFVETIRQMMERNACASAQLFNIGSADTVAQGALQLYRFVEMYLDHMLRPCGPQVCRLVFREILSDTSSDREMFEALLESVVEHFSRPLVTSLSAIVRAVSPELSEAQISLSTHAILGQCSFYVTHGPFIEKMSGRRFADAPLFDELVRQVAVFSLRGLRCDEATIATTLNQVALSPLDKSF